MNKKNSIKANFIYNLLYNILNIIIPLITAPYTSRVLGAENIGIYSYTYSLVSTIIMFGALGSATYAQKEIASVGDDIQERSYIFWEVFWVKGITTVLIGSVFFIYAITDRRIVYYVLQIPFFIAAILDVSWLFQGLEQFGHIAIRNIAVRIVGVVLMILFVRDRNDLPIYLMIISISQMFGNLSMWPYVKKYVTKIRIRPKQIKHHFKEMLVYFIPSITYQIYAVLDKAMLGWIIGSDYENGFYEQAYKIVNMAVNVISAYTIVMRSRMSYLFSQEKYEEIGIRMVKSSDIIAFLVFPMTFGLAIISAGMVPWFFGAGYSRVVNILYVFCPIFIFMGYSRMLGTHLLTPSGRQAKSNVGQCMAAIINVCLNVVLIPLFDAVGAAIASVCAEAIITIVYFWMVRKEFSLKVVIRTGWKKLLASIIMFGVLFQMRTLYSATILGTMSQIISAIIVYGLGLLLLRDSFVIMFIRDFFVKLKRRS